MSKRARVVTLVLTPPLNRASGRVANDCRHPLTTRTLNGIASCYVNMSGDLVQKLGSVYRMTSYRITRDGSYLQDVKVTVWSLG